MLQVVVLLLVINGVKYLNPNRVLVDGIDEYSASEESLGFNIVIYIVPYVANAAFCASNWCVLNMSSLRKVRLRI